MRSLAFLSRTAFESRFEHDILQTEVSEILIGTFSLECSVLPLCNRVAAIPDKAVASATSPLVLTVSSIRLSKYVFPVPPLAFKQKSAPCPVCAASIICVYAPICSLLSGFSRSWTLRFSSSVLKSISSRRTRGALGSVAATENAAGRETSSFVRVYPVCITAARSRCEY